MINVMQNSLSMALYTNNATIVSDTLTRAMGAVLFADQPVEDGIHRDGSFLQHAGIIYNGNYGKDLVSWRVFVMLTLSSTRLFNSRAMPLEPRSPPTTVSARRSQLRSRAASG